MIPSPGQLVEFTVGERTIRGQVITSPIPDVPWYFVVDADGQLYDRLPEEPWAPAPAHMTAPLRGHTDAQLRRSVVRRRISLLVTGQPPRRLRPARTKKRDKPMPPPGGSVRGRLARGDIPLRTSVHGSSHLAPEFERRLVYVFDTTRRLQLKRAIASLSARAPRQAEAYIRCFVGGWPWTDDDGRVLTCPMRPSQLAAVWDTGRSNVTNALRAAHAALSRDLGWDPRDYLRPSPDPVDVPEDTLPDIAC